MQIHTEITRLDLLKMQIALFFKFKIDYITFILMLCFVLFSGIIIWILLGVISSILGFSIFIVIAIVFQMITATAAKGFIGNHTFEITDSGFSEITEGTQTISSWDAIDKVYRTKQYIFVVISAYRVHIIPRRAFENNEEFEKFGTLIVEKSEHVSTGYTPVNESLK
jgi:hypothetical protein